MYQVIYPLTALTEVTVITQNALQLCEVQRVSKERAFWEAVGHKAE